MPKMNATAVIPLTDNNLEFLKKIQFNAEIPEGALYLAFLEDGDACFIDEELKRPAGYGFNLPKMTLVTYHENVLIDYED